MLEQHANTPFPQHLSLNTLPYTIINVYTQEERNSLFGTDTDLTASQSNKPMINAMRGRRNYDNQTTRSDIIPRARINEFCECCGEYGHNLKKNEQNY